MAVFSIITPQPNPVLTQRIAMLYPNHTMVSDRSWLISVDGSAAAIAKSLGVTERNEAGVGTSEFGHLLVIQVTSNYWGYGSATQWEWLKSAFQGAPS